MSLFLEGPRAEVERLYETLNHGPRHKDLLLLLSEPLLRGSSQIGRWRILAPAGARRLLALMGRTLNRG